MPKSKTENRKSKTTSPLRVFFGGLFYLALLVVVLGAATFYGWAGRNKLLGKIASDPLAFLKYDPRDTFHQDSVNVLVIGCDEDRWYRGVTLHGSNIIRSDSRSDMMMLARLDFDSNQVTAISIPRDTMCQLPGYPRHKINAYHAIAKKDPNDLTRQAVEHILPGVKVDKVIDLNFEAFQKLVDAVGGVNVTVPKAMNYDDNAGFLHIHLKPGYQHMDGEQAMGYVRFRHDRESDFGREGRQKDFALAFKQQAFKNLFKLPELADEGQAVLGNAVNNQELYALLAFMRRVPPDHVKMGTLPVVDGPGSFLIVDRKLLPRTLAEYGFQPYGLQAQSSHGADSDSQR